MGREQKANGAANGLSRLFTLPSHAYRPKGLLCHAFEPDWLNYPEQNNSCATQLRPTGAG